MRRHGNLWHEVTCFENLHEAATAVAAGKRSRPDVAHFLMNLEPELVRLRRELLEGGYRPGGYRTFLVREPKERLISAAPFRDRVVHHALTGVLEPLFDRRFTSDSYSCRRGFGTHAALERAKEGCRRYPHVLKCDVQKYFASIDHDVLNGLLARVVKCRPTLELAGRIFAGSNPQEEVAHYFPGDDLFSPHERRRGLPLGNQTSQFFANVYLNPLDHFVARELKPGAYMRYVDDFLLFGENRTDLLAMLAATQEFLCGLRLRVHPRKSRVYRTVDGVTFLGWRLFPDRTRLVRDNVTRFRRRMREMQRLYALGELACPDVACRVRAWLAHAAHGDTIRLREQLLAAYAFPRGTAV